MYQQFQIKVKNFLFNLDFYSTTNKTAFSKPDYNLTNYNNCYNKNPNVSVYKESLNKTKIEKENWFNNRKDFAFNENPHPIINQNNVNKFLFIFVNFINIA
jgi:hypothetical protein